MTPERMTPDQVASLEAQRDAYEARRIRRRDIDLACPRCGDDVGTIRILQRGDATTVMGLELTPGLIVTGHRTYGPSSRASARTAARLVVTTPGPVDIECRCGHAFAIAVPRGSTV